MQKEYNLLKHLRIFPQEYWLFYEPQISFKTAHKIITEEKEIHIFLNATNKTFKITLMAHDMLPLSNLLGLIYHSLSLTIKLSSNFSALS